MKREFDNITINKVNLSRKIISFVDSVSENLFRRIRISQRLLITFILASILPICLVGFLSIRSSTKAMEENISNYSLQILTQVSYNLVNELNRLQSLSMEIMTSDEMRGFDDSLRGKKEISRLDAVKNLESLFESKLSDSEDIASIVFYPLNYDIVAGTDVLINFSNKDKNSIFNRIILTNGSPYWIFLKNKETELGIDTDAKYSGGIPIRVETPVLFRKISSMYDSKILGVVHIAPKKQELEKIVADTEIGKDGKVILLNADNKVISSKDEKLLGNDVYPEIGRKLKESTQSKGDFFVNISNVRMLVCYDVMDGLGWKVVSMIPFNNLTTRIDQITIYVVYIILICILVALLISYMVTRSVCIPINRVNETVEYLGKGDFSKTLDVKFEDEISSFSNGFNKMIEDMQSLITEMYITKIEKLDSDFKALQAQINPHFLYNTLESINSLALIKGDMEISKMIRGLASVFRYSIKNSGKFVELKDEIEHVRLYILLQALKYDERIKVEYNIPQEFMQKNVLKFILQPLVENAIIHGIEKSNSFGLIKIEVYRREQNLCITVSDNGKGMDEKQLNAVRALLNVKKENRAELQQVKKDSIGILNIQSRIKLNFGEDYGVSIDSSLGMGTVVSIIIPFE
jgi:two-component system, sensor histidine kinase YesM